MRSSARRSAMMWGCIGRRARGRIGFARRPECAAVLGTISRRMILRGQFFPQLLRGQLEELPEAQLGQIQAQQAVRRLILAAAGPEATQVPVQTLQVQ